jgi:glutathione S-transferase
MSSTSTPERKLTLIYFDIAGKGEALRLELNAAGLAFTDKRVGGEVWQALKPTLQFGQLPCLIVEEGDKKSEIVQSSAIQRYIGTIAGEEVGLYPTDPIQAALVDSIVAFEADAFMGWRCVKYNERNGFSGDILDEKTLEALMNNINTKIVPAQFKKLEAILGRSTTGWFANTAKPTIADFEWGCTLQIIKGSTDFPVLAAFVDKFNAYESNVNYYGAKAAAAAAAANAAANTAE